jgi:hypothetical protein
MRYGDIRYHGFHLFLSSFLIFAVKKLFLTDCVVNFDAMKRDRERVILVALLLLLDLAFLYPTIVLPFR